MKVKTNFEVVNSDEHYNRVNPHACKDSIWRRILNMFYRIFMKTKF